MGITDKNDDDAPAVEPHDEVDPDMHDGVKDPVDIPAPFMLRNMDASGKQQPDQAD